MKALFVILLFLPHLSLAENVDAQQLLGLETVWEQLPENQRDAALDLFEQWQGFPYDEKLAFEAAMNRFDVSELNKKTELMDNYRALKLKAPNEASNERWGKTPPELRSKLLANYAYWMTLEDSDRSQILVNYKKFEALTPIQRLDALENHKQFVTLPMKQRFQILNFYAVFQKLPVAIQNERITALKQYRRKNP